MSFEAPFSSNPFMDARPLPGEDSRYDGSYEGDYLDPEHEELWRTAQEVKNVPPYMDMYASLKGRARNPHIQWGLNIIYKTETDLIRAKDGDEYDKVLAEFTRIVDDNQDLMARSRSYARLFAAQSLPESEQFAELTRQALDAYANNYQIIYEDIVAVMQQLDPEQTKQARSMMWADYAQSNL